MTNDLEILQHLRRHGVPFIIIGGHAVNFHGYGRATEDTDVVWMRSAESEKALFNALNEIDAHYIAKEIDPATGIEQTHPVTPAFIKATPLMMLWTRLGFLDLFDYVPGLPGEDPGQLLASGIEAEGLKYASLGWLRQMKKASGRSKDQLDLDNLPE